MLKIPFNRKITIHKPFFTNVKSYDCWQISWYISSLSKHRIVSWWYPTYPQLNLTFRKKNKNCSLTYLTSEAHILHRKWRCWHHWHLIWVHAHTGWTLRGRGTVSVHVWLHAARILGIRHIARREVARHKLLMILHTLELRMLHHGIRRGDGGVLYSSVDWKRQVLFKLWTKDNVNFLIPLKWKEYPVLLIYPILSTYWLYTHLIGSYTFFLFLLNYKVWTFLHPLLWYKVIQIWLI
jgi:hypothetical protein